MSKRRRLFGLLLVFALVFVMALAACGGDDDDESGETEEVTPTVQVEDEAEGEAEDAEMADAEGEGEAEDAEMTDAEGEGEAEDAEMTDAEGEGEAEDAEMTDAEGEGEAEDAEMTDAEGEGEAEDAEMTDAEGEGEAEDAEMTDAEGEGEAEDAEMTDAEGEGEAEDAEMTDAEGEGEAAMTEADFGVVTIGMNAEYPPFEYVDEDGEIAGFDPALVALIAERAGFEYELVNTRWDGIFVALASGEFDMVASAATITDEREEIVNFTNPYFYANQRIAVLEDNAESMATVEDLAGLRIGVQSGTTGDIFASDEVPGSEVVRYDEITLAFQALANGDVDAIINDGPTSADIIEKNPDMGAVLVGEPLSEEFYGIAVQPDLPELLDAVNMALEELIADGTYRELYVEWFGIDPDPMFLPEVDMESMETEGEAEDAEMADAEGETEDAEMTEGEAEDEEAVEGIPQDDVEDTEATEAEGEGEAEDAEMTDAEMVDAEGEAEDAEMTEGEAEDEEAVEGIPQDDVEDAEATEAEGEGEAEDAEESEAADAEMEGLAASASVVQTVREMPVASADVLAQIPLDGSFTVTGVSEDGKYYQVAYEEAVGWVYAAFVTVEGDAEALPVIPAEAMPEAEDAEAMEADSEGEAEDTEAADAEAESEAAMGTDFGVVTIGMNAEYPPFEFVDEDNEIAGFDPALVAILADRAGFEYELVNTRWDGIFVALASGEFDMVASAATITEEREEIVDFSNPYFYANQRIAVLEPNASSMSTVEDLAGLRIGVQSGTTGDIFASDEVPGSEVVRYDEITLAFQALANGDVDAIINDGPTSADIIEKNPDMGAVLVGDPLSEEFYGIAVQPDLPELLDAINAALEDVIADGTYAELYMEWFGVQPDPMFLPAE